VTVGAGWSIAVDAASFGLAAVCLGALRLPASVPRRTPGGFAEGWRVFRGMRWVAVSAVSFCVANLVNVGPWQILGPALTGPAGWGAVLSVRAAGLLLASVVMYRLTFRHPLRVGALLGTLGGLPLLALGVRAPVWALAAAAFLGALGFTVSGVTWDTALQTSVPREALSRVASIDDLLSFGAIPLGELLTGPAATAFGAAVVALTCGLLYVVSRAVMLGVSDVRTLTATSPEVASA
jgi:hypothetical protein